jgi:hypothetical protein
MFLLGHYAWLFARNRSRPEGTRFPAPSSGQALRPAPVMELVGAPTLDVHASAANDGRWWLVPLFSCSLFNACRWLANARWSCLGCERWTVVACSLVFLFFCSMHVGGLPTLGGHASAANDDCWWLFPVGAYSYTRLPDCPEAPSARLYPDSAALGSWFLVSYSDS